MSSANRFHNLQVKYVVELARALGETPGVYRVDLLTRQISAPDVDWSYGEPTEMLISSGVMKPGLEKPEATQTLLAKDINKLVSTVLMQKYNTILRVITHKVEAEGSTLLQSNINTHSW